MILPVSRRDFDVFLSDAHVDRLFVDHLYGWLTECAGLNVWYDARQMAGQRIASGLKNGIERSRAAIIVGSAEALSRGWVQQEVDIALDELSRSEAFRVIPLRLADAKVDELIRGLDRRPGRQADACGRRLDLEGLPSGRAVAGPLHQPPPLRECVMAEQ